LYVRLTLGLLLGILATVGIGCGSSVAEDCFGRDCDAGGDTDADTDADGDSDSDGDSDTGTGTDTDSSTQHAEHVDCEAEPLLCEDIGSGEQEQYFGCCFEGSVYFCQSGVLDSIDCEAQGYVCGYSESFEVMDCV
jgi:hypothetical protein